MSKKLAFRTFCLLVAFLAPVLLLTLGHVETADSGGCKLMENTWPSNDGRASCDPSIGSNCYHCWYYNEPPDDNFSFCAESPDGSVAQCDEFDALYDTPNP